MMFDQADFSNCPGEGFFGGPYEARNSTGTGWYNMYSGTRNSVNTYFLQLEELTGVCAPFELATEMGVRLTDPKVERLPAFTLGIADASPLEMAEAYATFAARGMHCASRPVTQILDSSRQRAEGLRPAVHPGDAAERRRRGQQRAPRRHRGRLRLRPGAVRPPPPARPAPRPGAEGGVVLRLHHPVRRRRHDRRHQRRGQPESLVGKTVDGSTIYEATGSGFAAPIWGDALKPLTAGQPYDDFVYPVGIEGVGVTAANPPKPPKGPKGNHGGGHGNGGGGGSGDGGCARRWRCRPTRAEPGSDPCGLSPAGGVPPRRRRRRRRGP